MSHALSVAIIFMHALVGYLGLAVFFFMARGLPRVLFTTTHFGAVAIIFTALAYVYFSYVNHFEIFHTTAFFLLSIFVIEFCVYTFIYTKDLWFLNPIDWGGSVIIAGLVIYGIGKLVS